MKRWLQSSTWLFLGILALAAFLRFYRLGHSLQWIDEWAVLWLGGMERGPLETLWWYYTKVLQTAANQHMAFQYFWVNLFLHLYKGLGLQPNILLTRLPFALLGFLSVPFFSLAGRTLFGRNAGLWTGVAAATSFFLVYQSRDATSYAPLLFFLSVQLYGAAGYAMSAQPERRYRIAFVAGALGGLLSHVTAWFFLAAEGLFFLGRAVWLHRAKQPWSRAREAMVLIAATCVPMLHVPWRLLTGFKPPGASENLVLPPAVDFICYQLASFGFGRGQGRTIFFVAVLALAVWACMRARERRPAFLLVLSLVFVPALLVVLSPHVDLYPRYFAASMPALVLWTGCGLDFLASGCGLAGARGRRVGALCVLGLLALELAQPYRTLFALRSKLMPIAGLLSWLDENLPAGGLYIWQSGYNLREIPQSYPAPGRQAAYATMHSGDIKVGPAADNWAPFARDLFRRFPLAAFLATDFPEPPLSGPWQWLGTDFAHRTNVLNRELGDLNRVGFSHYGVIEPGNDEVMVYWNRPEDVVARARAQGKALVGWTEGEGWQYIQTQQHLLLAALPRAADYRAWNLTDAPVQAKLVIQAAAQEDGALRVARTGASEAETLTTGFRRSNGATLEVGPITLEPGEQVLHLRQVPSERVALLVFSLELQPATAANSTVLPKE